jgi:hypothetical protein
MMTLYETYYDSVRRSQAKYYQRNRISLVEKRKTPIKLAMDTLRKKAYYNPILKWLYERRHYDF